MKHIKIQFYDFSDSLDNEWKIGYLVLNYGCPERISGPPEDCYPAENSEVEIVGVQLGEISIPLKNLSSKFLETVTDECCMDAIDQEEAQREAEQESKWDSERD